MGKIISLLLILFLLIGCDTTTTSSAVEEIDEPFVGAPPPINPDIPQENITLEVWLDLDFTKDDDLFEQIAQDFEQAYDPWVNVEIQSFVRESIPPKVKRALQVGTPPDVVQGHVYAMAGQGLAEPLKQQWQEWLRSDPQAHSQFLPAALEEATWEGTLYGIPLDIYTLVLLYNKDHFDETNLPYPEGDYDLLAFSNAAAVLTKPEQGRYGLGLTADPAYVYAWLTSAGGDVLIGTPETGFTLTLDSKNNIDALRFLTNMVENGYGRRPTTRPHDYEDPRKQFLKGEVSMFFGTPYDIHIIQSTNPDFPLGVARLPETPAGESAASVLGSSGLFIPRGARHQEAAFEFMKWMTSDRYAIPMARRLGRYPAKSWLPTSPYFTENLLLIPFFNQLNAARPYRLDLYPEAEKAFADAIKHAFYDNNTDPANKALQDAQRTGQASVQEKSL